MKKYEVIVVGAGTGGCMAASALASAGISALLVDRKKSELIGEKICGDAVGKHHFDNLSLRYPEGKEKEGNITGIKVYSPDLETEFRISGPKLEGFILNRYLFGQRLLKDALDEGVTFLDSTYVLGPIISNCFVKGIFVKNLESGSKIKIESRIVIDASGIAGVIRKRLPLEMVPENNLDKEDTVICYREIRKLEEEIEEPDFCRIYLNAEKAPGGYYWIFPKGGGKSNVGLGVSGKQNHPNPKILLKKNVLSMKLFRSSAVISGGGGVVPTRRPLDSMVGNGVAMIGDAACQVNPIHGGGIGSSMMGGRIAGETAIEALEKGSYGKRQLWPINIRFMKVYGAKQATLDVFRLFLQNLTNSDLNFGMKYQLIKEEDVLKASMGDEILLNVTDVTKRIFAGIGRLSFLKSLYVMARDAKKVKRLYENYPDSPEGFQKWKEQAKILF